MVNNDHLDSDICVEELTYAHELNKILILFGKYNELKTNLVEYHL